MNEFQNRIKKFAEDRDWSQFHNPKDLLLGIVEEVGEIRNIVKWEQNLETLKEVLLKNKAELEDNIGDIYWFLALLANGSGIDIDKAIDSVIKNNELRFPAKDVKSQHTNLYLGGKDKQYSE
ncbi:MAG: MazG nucleotide pyrophosphohydrolase domain-containing protein [Patescibacteria group bacterium]